MSTADIVGIIIAVIVVAVFAAAAVRIVWQRRMLRERFGDEYDRVVADKGGRAAAEAELRQRQRRHAELPLKELSAEDRAQFTERWTEVQSQFVDDPAAAVRGADRLVSRIVADRGYPVVDYSDRLAHLSVDHAQVLTDYRDAHDVSVRNDAGHASTEELRQALVHYRVLIADLLGEADLNNTVSYDASEHNVPPLAAGTTTTVDPAPVSDNSADDAALVTKEPLADAANIDVTTSNTPLTNEPTLVSGTPTRTEE
jgi:hypothetical protein